MSKKENQAASGESPIETNRIDGLPYEDVASSWLAAIIESADDAVISKTLEGIIASWNKGAERIFGYTGQEVIGKPVLILIPLDHQDEEPNILSRIKAGERIEHYETVRQRKDGTLIDVSLTVSPIKASNGEIIGASKIVRDITARKQIEAKLQEQTAIVETINRLGQLLSAELDQQKLVQSVTDAATELTNAQFGAFFYNFSDQEEDSPLRFSVSGVSPQAFEHFPMPRAKDLFGPTFRTDGSIRLDEVGDDPRYNRNSPFYEMAAGHLEVRSYLAVPIVSRNSGVIGGLFFGHSKAAAFTGAQQRMIEGLAVQTAIAMDNARLYDKAQQMLKEREQLLEREQQARKQAETASQTKDEFLGLLSHELRTPLNAILGWTRMLGSSQLDQATIASAIETIDRNAKLQSRLIEDMLDVSRIMSGKLRLDAQPVDLTSVINAAVETLRPAADAKEIRVYVVLDYGAGMILGDPVRLQQIVWNLLSNAIKFTPKNGNVKVFLERINSHLEITVSDNGTGIDEEFLPHVFERFRQADSSASKKYGGLGLGLSIVRQLVELHGGTVEAANQKDERGAIFTVKLPVMAVRQRIDQKDNTARFAHLSGGEALSFHNRPDLNGIRILAVDDDPDARLLLTAILEQCGAMVKTCGSAAETLAAIEEFKPDVLVSDIGMPGEDGYSLIRKIRAGSGTHKRIPAVALTAFARVEDRLKALSAGYNMHVPKPVEPAELTMVILSLANHH